MAFIASHWLLWLILTIVFLLLTLFGSVFGFLLGIDRDRMGPFLSGMGVMFLGGALTSITGTLFIISLIIQIINYAKA